MGLLFKTLFLCLALALANAAPTEHGDSVSADHHGVHHDPQGDQDHSTAQDHQDQDHSGLLNRCDGIEFDAITPDEKGITYFIKDKHLWKGFDGPAHPIGAVFTELEDQSIGHIDAAFRMHRTDADAEDHDHIYFLVDDKVFRYYNHSLEDGYPKAMVDDFPGVPSHVDAAVECPKGECGADSVLFFKGQDVHSFDLDTKTVKTKTWSALPNCSSVFRWQEHYYCFHGNTFTRFNQVSGAVTQGTYPKDARHYFMKCPNFGHGRAYQLPLCSEASVDAITTDDAGKTYFFKGPIYMRLDSSRDGLHAFPITRGWHEMTNGVDAVFSYTDKMYMIKDDQVYIYKSSVPYTLVEGYPKSLKEELGIEGHVDAAFVCGTDHTVNIIQGNKMIEVDLSATPRAKISEVPLGMSGIDAGRCGADGIEVFKGSEFFKYDSKMVFTSGRIAPVPEKFTSEKMGCRDEPAQA